MPNNVAQIPFLNPIRFVPLGSTAINFDSDWYYNQIKYYETKIQYFQKWVFGDIIYLQVASNFSPVAIDLRDCHGNTLTTFSFTVVPTAIINPDLIIYECSIPVPIVDEGEYFFLLKIGSDATLEQFISEPQYFSDDPSNTLFFKAKNSYNKFDVVFKTGIQFGFRVEGSFGPLSPMSVDSVWQDQPLDLETIDSIPYRQFKLAIGGLRGVPDWVPDKVNRYLSCDSTLIQDRQYTKADGAKWETIIADYYPLRGWKIDVRETKNLYSLVAQNNFSPAEQFAVVFNIETKAFGTFNGNASNNVIQITKTE
jgi:hypothetical protein